MPLRQLLNPFLPDPIGPPPPFIESSRHRDLFPAFEIDFSVVYLNKLTSGLLTDPRKLLQKQIARKQTHIQFTCTFVNACATPRVNYEHRKLIFNTFLFRKQSTEY